MVLQIYLPCIDGPSPFLFDLDMKAAPDKIYLPIIEEDGKRLLCTNWWENDTSSRNAYVNETIPYIRKEALLEWLKGYNHPVTRLIVKMLIDKISSM